MIKVIVTMYCVTNCNVVGAWCLDHICYLVNSTLVSLSATVKTDVDKTVVVTALETLDDVLKALRKLSFPMSKEAGDSLLTSVQDVLENKVLQDYSAGPTVLVGTVMFT